MQRTKRRRFLTPLVRLRCLPFDPRLRPLLQLRSTIPTACTIGNGGGGAAPFALSPGRPAQLEDPAKFWAPASLLTLSSVMRYGRNLYGYASGQNVTVEPAGTVKLK